MKRLMALFNKRLPGVIGADLALSPLGITLVFVLVLSFLAIIYYGISYLFLSEILIKGVRKASIDPNVDVVRNLIFNSITHLLPQERQGMTLIIPMDIQINPYDGDFVTVKASYKVMLPGVEFWKKLGGSPGDWVVPAKVKFSMYREY